MSSSATTRSGRADRGFVLATTLLVTTLLTVMLAASFLLVSSEQRTTDNSFGTSRALALAQAGLQNYFAQSRGLRDTSTYDSLRIPLVQGYADVVAARIRPGGGGSGGLLPLWVVRSTGVSTSGAMAGQVQGSHTVAQFAQLNPGLLPARAAMVALNGLRIVGGGNPVVNPVSGHDLGSVGGCTSPGGLAADTFAYSVPSGRLNLSANISAPQGVGTETWYPAWNNLYDSTHIDWPGLLGGNFNPDLTIPPAGWPPTGGSTNTLIFVTGDAVVPTGTRRGTLVVAGNVTLSNNTDWEGIIVAGGALFPNATNAVVHGMVVTGLNEALGQTIAANDIQPGTVRVQWAWCYTQSGLGSLSALVPMKNAWADTWSTY